MFGAAVQVAGQHGDRQNYPDHVFKTNGFVLLMTYW
jgi:hypothetical protein